MAKQPIDIGVQGNDGTGDSIREAFRKVNDNFTDLYAVFGAGGQINSTNLDDMPSSYGSDQVFITNATGDAVLAKSLTAGTGIDIDNSALSEIIISSTSSSLNTDPSPSLGGPLNANGLSIGKIASPTTLVVDQWNAVHGPGGSTITIDDLVISKGYADRRYIQQSGGGAAGQLRVRNEPSDRSEYTKLIIYWTNGNAVITAHGFDSGADGIAFKYESTGDAATGLVIDTVYYLRYVDANQLSVHPTVEDAKAGTNKITVPDSGTGTQTFIDAYLDTTLSGNWLSNEALPRISTVRRQGDTMDGTLLLADHPGTLAGAGTPNGDDDLQAATKYYVDNSSFASQVNLFVSTSGDDTQANTPSGKEGRAFAYAYATIGGACAKAEEIINLAASEPGPYRQTITYTVGTTSDCKTQSVDISGGSGYTPVQDTLNANREYIRAEVVGYINATYPDLHYNSDTCSRDVGIIIDAIIIDVLVSGNYQSINAGKAYFKNVSALVASGTQQTETVNGIAYAKYLAGQVLQGLAPVTTYQTVYTRVSAIGTVTSPMRTSVAAKFDIITSIITDGIAAAPARSYGTGTVSVVLDNGGAGHVDQGSPSNIDIIPGKLIRGLSTGAVARIVSYTAGSLTDTITGNLLTPFSFAVNEKLEYAESNKDIQITIRVESGVYYEDLPIRVPANVTVKGDEQRRSIIRPRNRASQSPWVQTYFFRDTTFDGLTIASTNYGYHYLQDPTRVMNVGASYTNAGGYTSSAKLLEINRAFIQTEVNAYMTATYPAVVYDTALSYRDTGLIVDAIVSDLRTGGKAGVVNAASYFYGGTIPVLERTACAAGMNYIATLAQSIIANTLLTGSTTPPKRGSTTQVINTSITAEAGTGTIITNLAASVAFAFNVSYNPPKNNKNIDMLLMNDAVKLHNLTGQGHGAFMCVLDPAGSIGSKSPYVQSCTSLSGSINAQRFAGGQYIDGFVGRLPTVITNVAGTILTVSGLTQREPIAPTAFYNSGYRYQVDTVSSWDAITGIATIVLNASTPWSGGNIAIILETPGNRSMLSDNFTQVNDLGYGIVAQNTGLGEQVSVFTYYCYTSMLASNGGQVRSVSSSSAHGTYGLRAIGSDPTEAPDQITLSDNMVQSVKAFKYSTLSTSSTSSSIIAYIQRYRSIPTATSELEITHSTNIARYEVKNIEKTNISYNLAVFRISAISQANPCIVTTLTNKTITGATQANPCVITSNSHGYLSGDFIKITGVTGMTQLNNKNYYVSYLNANTYALYTDSTLTTSVNSTSYTAYSSTGTSSAAHTFHRGDRVTFSSIGGMTTLNNNLYYVNPLSATTFALYTDSDLTLSVNSTLYSAYTSGGTVTDLINYSINAATKANPCQITTTVAHSFKNSDYITIASVVGMTQINGSFYAKVNGTNTVQLYSDADLATPVDSSLYTTYISGGTVSGGQEILKLNLATTANDSRVATGLSEDLYNDQNMIVRTLQNFKFGDVANVAPTRPSTALEFFDTYTFTANNLYRIIAYNLSESTGSALGNNVAILTTDQSFDYVRPLVLTSGITTTDPDNGAKKMGSQIGDTKIAIDATSLDANDIVACNSNKWVFAWDGKLHTIVSYTPAVGLIPAYLTIVDVYDNNNVATSTGISSAFSTVTGTTLRAGLPAAATGQVTIKISTCRANGHDFLDIGTGGYNTTNFPSAIYGNPAIAADQGKEILETTKGRVFYVSTDQNGIFRVGPYFKVDQGTGTVTFSASIALSNLDGIGFKRGVVVSEFSTDSTLTNNAADTVPVQSAIRGYIDRRLGQDHSGNDMLLSNLIGPGYLPLDGSLDVKGNLNMAGNRLLNLGAPSVADDAATKGYVDTAVAGSNQLSELTDVTITSAVTNNILVYDGVASKWKNVTATGDLSISLDTGTGILTASVAALSITDSKVSASAAIVQSKLAMTAASPRANATGITQADLGLASFDSANFEATSGWIGIKAGGVALSEIATISDARILGNFSGVAASPIELTALTVGTKSLEAVFTSNGALTRTASETFAIVGITTTGTANSLVKTDANGIIDVKGVKINSSSVNILDVTSTTVAVNTPGSVSIISGAGTTEANTNVVLKGQFTLGASSTFVASSATNATNSTNATKLDVSGTYRSAATAATVNTIAARDGSGDSAFNIVTLASITKSGTNGSGDIGQTGNRFGTVYGTASSALYADLAEYYTADKEYEPGTVLIFGGSAETTTTNIFSDSRLAGVVSTKPAYSMNDGLEGTKACIALQGRVPCKVVGVVKKGDMLTTAGIPGHAAKAMDPKVGTIIGKALEDKDYSEAGVIEVAVGRV